jgi:hypothetical protein
MRKITLFQVLASTVGILSVAGLIIWGSISLINYAISSTTQIVNSPKVKSHINNAKEKVERIKFKPQSCWSEAQNLMSIEPWLEYPPIDNLKTLSISCMEMRPAVCEIDPCEINNERTGPSHRRTI